MFRRETLARCVGRVSAPDDVRVSVAEPSYHLYIIAVPPDRVRCSAARVRAAFGARKRRERITLRGDHLPSRTLRPKRESANRSPDRGVRFVASLTMPQTAETLRALRAGHPTSQPVRTDCSTPPEHRRFQAGQGRSRRRMRREPQVQDRRDSSSGFLNTNGGGAWDQHFVG